MKNFKQTFNTAILLVSIVLSAACSTQSRTNNWEPDTAELTASLTSFFEGTTSSNNPTLIESTRVDILPTEAEATANAGAAPKVIYYAESEKTGLALSVAGLLDFSILGLPNASLYDLAEAKVLLIDSYTDINREFTLIVTVKFVEPDSSVGEYQTAAFKTTSYKFTGDKLTISFENFDLTSFDLSDVEDDLSPVIQLKITDKSGLDYGQFSSLVGFGN